MGKLITAFFLKSRYYDESPHFTCAAYKNENQIIISFRGTDSVIDIVGADADIIIGTIPIASFILAQILYLLLKSYPVACL